MEVIKIRPMGRRNHQTLLLVAGLLILACVIAIGWPAPPALQIPLCLCTLLCLITAIGKGLEPRYSLKLSPLGVCYHHRKGHWFLPWQNLQRIDRLCNPEDRAPMNYLGLRLRHPDEHYLVIRPRLALALMQEQRPLAHLAQPGCHSGHCLNWLPDKTQLPHPNLTGVRAAYATHQTLLRQELGFDLYLPRNTLDRDLDDLVSLIRKYQLKVTRETTTGTTE